MQEGGRAVPGEKNPTEVSKVSIFRCNGVQFDERGRVVGRSYYHWFRRICSTASENIQSFIWEILVMVFGGRR